MCFSDFSFRNTFCVSMGKTLWKSQNVSLNGFFWGKHHLAPAVSTVSLTEHVGKTEKRLWYNNEGVLFTCCDGKNPAPQPPLLALGVLH